ncbi:MAG: DUF5819 family protein [Aeromicrobium sp.]
MPDARDEPVRPWQRRVVNVLALLVGLHSALLMLWLAPSSPIRDLVGSRNLASYVDPYFQQDVDAVDPSVQFVDESFQVRALVKNGSAKAKVTEWVNLTKEDLDDVRFNPNPARVHLIPRRLATNLNRSMFALEPDQRRIIRGWEATDLTSARTAALNKAGDNPAVVQNFMAYDQMATQFASLYATSKWKGKVLQVQFKVGRRSVPEFSKRHDITIKDVDYLYFSFGWRPRFTGSLDAQTPYDSYVRG